MRKVFSLFFVQFFILIGFTGCAYNGYSGDNPNLYTVAINSVLWNNGHSFSADKYIDPKIKVIDEDRYGRIMFTYYEKHYAGTDMSFSALLICQHSNEREVFYYEDINYIIKSQTLNAQNINDFEDEEIEQLKAVNDWDQKINFDKCIKKEIIRCKPTIPCEDEIKNKIVDEFDLNNERYSLFVDFLTSDTGNDNFIIYGFLYLNAENGIYFIGIVENDNGLLTKINFLIPFNVFDYKTEFKEFKKTNNWI